MKIKKDKKKAQINIKYDIEKNDKFDGWYERYENNGWRPVNTYFLIFYDIDQ